MTNEIYFHLEGEFLGVCALDGYKLKYLRLRTAERDVMLKVPKELRAGLVYKLAIGDRIRCEGIQKDLKFKASVIEKVDRAQVDRVRIADLPLKWHSNRAAPVTKTTCQNRI